MPKEENVNPEDPKGNIRSSPKGSFIRNIRKLLRIRQWYKGVVVFMGVFFGGKILSLSFNLTAGVILGFILLGLTSSINYIINDILDLEKDRHHPEKRNRPIASGAISVGTALIIAFLIGIVVIFGSLYVMKFLLGPKVAFYTILMVGCVFFNGLLYNLVLKHYIIVDILTLSLIYIWRTWLGCFIAEVNFSPWLFLLIYLLALFLAVNKRIADLDILGKNAANHKKIYEQYDEALLKTMMEIITVGLFLSYSLYCILGPVAGYSGEKLANNVTLIIFTIPIAMFLILRYLYICKKDPKIARNTEKAIKDIPLVIGGLILAMMIYIANYVDLSTIFVFP